MKFQSGSPFRFSDASCSQLSLLRACSPLTLPNCSYCQWECKIVKNPVQLLHGCSGSTSFDQRQGCHSDVLGFLDGFLKIGIQVEWDEAQDSYFSNCTDYKTKNGVCGFNSSDPNKQFICFPPETSIPSWNPNRVAILSSIFLLTCVFLVISVGIVIFCSRKLNSQSSEEDPTTLFLHSHRSASLLPLVFTYKELESSTNKFDPKCKIGDGGFGRGFRGRRRNQWFGEEKKSIVAKDLGFEEGINSLKNKESRLAIEEEGIKFDLQPSSIAFSFLESFRFWKLSSRLEWLLETEQPAEMVQKI
ncbi:hypothetical protein SLEP1_g16081 [Rubroshorea leprosula]|uniref:Uncharacterized protein n=1 Tax=Rubroshorea leprosula TaxID=152421 RepID=A0AAV5J041_9ROSI|nr:hypothetical protein SLEP1_g16081 [Rubroshorea leprosula]